MSVENSFKSLSHNTGRAVGSLAAVAVLVLSTPVSASHIQTPDQLRDACLNSEGNVVVLDHAIKVSLPSPGASAPLSVASGCTLVLGPNAKLETEFVQFSFAGPLVIQSVHPTQIQLVKTLLSAPSISMNLTGFGTAFGSSESTLEATHGDLTIAMLGGAKIEVISQLQPGPQYGLYAAGRIQISASTKFTGLIDENNIRAEHGFSVALSQFDGLLKLLQVGIDVPQGGISVTAPATTEKVLVEMSESRLRVRDGITFELAGRESSINMKQVSMSGWGGVSANGGVKIIASSSVNGKVELSEVGIFDVDTATVLASAGSEGAVKVEKSDLLPDFDLRIETGAHGKTEVKENRLASSTIIRVATGPGDSSCTAQPNTISGTPQLLELCP